jgi:hypothetical protein
VEQFPGNLAPFDPETVFGKLADLIPDGAVLR